jgi:hypothetical protein
MAKRVWKEKVYPLETQIHLQRGYVAQHENALAQAQTTAKQPLGFGGYVRSAAEIEQLVQIVALRERDLAAARQKLAELEAQQAAA